MLATPTLQLREELLAQKGIGPDTADSILLYAGHRPIFGGCMHGLFVQLGKYYCAKQNRKCEACPLGRC